MLKTASSVMKNGPGFTAEAALHQTRDRYGLELRPASGLDGQSVAPAMVAECTNCTCTPEGSCTCLMCHIH